jgi:hypothetical protein
VITTRVCLLEIVILFSVLVSRVWYIRAI